MNDSSILDFFLRRMQIKYSQKASKQLKDIAKANIKDATLIIKKIESYAINPDIKHDLKVLKGKFEDIKRLRAGNFRILFDDEMNILLILEIKYRKDVYHD